MLSVTDWKVFALIIAWKVEKELPLETEEKILEERKPKKTRN